VQVQVHNRVPGNEGSTIFATARTGFVEFT
jgi:hypothetical protein